MDPRNDQQRRTYLNRVFEELRGPRRIDILARASHVLDLWAASTGVHPRYIARWRELLEQDVSKIRQAVLTDHPEAAALRHTMPFGGVLTNRERAALRENTHMPPAGR